MKQSLKSINLALIMSVFILLSTSLLAQTDKDRERNTSSEDKYSEPKGSTQNNDPGNAKNIKGSSPNSQSSGYNSGSQGTGQESGGGSSSGTQGSGSSGRGAGR